jgi:DNA polymerase I-like protein with 3'-5' exonuclease and polymerase domains
MLVTIENFGDMLDDLKQEKYIGFDTETYGLGYHDRLFSLILATEKQAYYLNFNAEPDHLGKKAPVVLNRSVMGELLPYTTSFNKVWMAHNAPFDMQKLANEGLRPPVRIHCTLITERLIRNDRMDLSLEEVARGYGFTKDMRVDEYINEHKLYTMIQIPGKDKREKNKHFDKVPFSLMAQYGENDAIIHRKIGLRQFAQYAEIVPK